ncbi:hypothetical protein ACFWWB_26870 [Streptomyces sp. NPDC058690]|uniref:hypothetical protein n=1 Tax=Streptomyces sp. NPDC058690 TaxID=3346600 RepID=UPI003664333B
MAETVRVRRLTDQEGQRLHRDVLAAERKERVRLHREKGIRWGERSLRARTGPSLQSQY